MELAMLVPARRPAFPRTRLVGDSGEHAVDAKKRQLRTAPCLARDVFGEAHPPLEPLCGVRLTARKHRANGGPHARTQARLTTRPWSGTTAGDPRRQ